MKRRRRILTVAGVLMAIALVDFLLFIDVDYGEPKMISIWRLFVTGLLAYFLAMGKNFARWITVVLTGLGAIAGFLGISIFLVSGDFPPGSVYLLIWLGITTVTYALISAFLAFSAGVTREIRRIDQRISFPNR